MRRSRPNANGSTSRGACVMRPVPTRVLDALSKPYVVGEHRLHCTVSMGVVVRGPSTREAETVLQDASIAMAEAQRAGGGRFVLFEAAMRDRATHRGGIEMELRQAI